MDIISSFWLIVWNFYLSVHLFKIPLFTIIIIAIAIIISSLLGSKYFSSLSPSHTHTHVHTKEQDFVFGIWFFLSLLSLGVFFSSSHVAFPFFLQLYICWDFFHFLLFFGVCACDHT